MNGSEWPYPDDLWAEDAEPPDLLQDVVPAIVERFARDRGRRLGVEPGALAAASITTLGSLVAAGNRLQMRQRDPHWTVRPITWFLLIGDPGTNKSAAIKEAVLRLDE